ncbi:hypothetical protein M441DRAFT_85087 [Trichoderma asperellum CBS 433.97]|uniref:CFEM domain-containing protein n=1 Tax=Trichoderma asperellum (strain ATCC 204424 / CBS 433.97 / NBRC 101777) TaxID=1042311 RepID=A0A2T3YQJ4_TRIA4|nr:hypothetical protein M441DRAFT_85087 [Trichoderma asperellum CBS 433.97]PTB34789.1 hypothetical protein M441DRAFT_85087 [Trichoderma asperellum CBS 433.97]
MKANLFLLFATGVAANIASIPQCAQSCLNKAAPTVGCSANNYGCLCNQISKIQGPVVSCVISTCSSGDIAISTSLVKQICG